MRSKPGPARRPPRRCAPTCARSRRSRFSGGSRNRPGMAEPCPKCAATLDQLLICTGCGFNAPVTATQRIEQLADRGSFHEADRHLWSGNPLHFSDGVSSYEKQVAEAQAETRLLDAVVTGRARVHTTAIGDSAPPGTAEFAFAHGLIDAVVERDRLRPVIGSLAGALRSREAGAQGKRESPEPHSHAKTRRDVWETVELARHPDRPSGRALAHAVFSDIFEIRGDRQGDDDDSVMAAIGRLGARPVVVVAQDRHSLGMGRTRASGYRKAQRAYSLAERFSLPLITLVDTPGASTDTDAEA